MANVTLKLPKPQPKQVEFLNCTKKYVGYGGSRGGGKSFAVRIKAIIMALNYKDIKQLIIRRTFPELKKNHIDNFNKLLQPLIQAKLCKYNSTNKEFKFWNGATISFMYCDKEKDTDKLQGAEYDIIYIDEATQLTEKMMKDITACCRGVNDYPKRVYCTCNPGGRGHAYIKRIFIDKRYVDGENPDDYEFIQSGVKDNQALMKHNPEYIAQLKALPPARRKAWLDGSWDVYEGQVFEEFRDVPKHYKDRQWTHVIDPFEIPKGWKIYRSYDFGYAKPFSCAWWAVDYDGCMYRIMEYYGCKKDEDNVGLKITADEQFKEIARIENEHPWLKGKKIEGVADPAIWDTSRGESVAETAMRYGIYFEPGDHKRIAGWMQLHYRLQFDDNGYPMMYIFKNCKGFIRTIPALEYSETNPEDVNSDQEDHIADETRYFCMMRPISPTITVKKQVHLEDPLNMFNKE